jgi:hypothetical protein
MTAILKNVTIDNNEEFVAFARTIDFKMAVQTA